MKQKYGKYLCIEITNHFASVGYTVKLFSLTFNLS